MAKSNAASRWAERNNSELAKAFANKCAGTTSREDEQLAFEAVRRLIVPTGPGRHRKKFGDLKRDTNLQAAVIEVEQLHDQGVTYASARQRVGKKRGYSSRHLQKHAWMARVPMHISAAMAPVGEFAKRLQLLAATFPRLLP